MKILMIVRHVPAPRAVQAGEREVYYPLLFYSYTKFHVTNTLYVITNVNINMRCYQPFATDMHYDLGITNFLGTQ